MRLAGGLIGLDPPYSNTGGKSPGVAVCTDYLTVTFPLPSLLVPDLGAWIVAKLRRVLCCAWGDPEGRERGMFGYRRSIVFARGQAVVAWGGNRDTMMLSIPGSACALICDWTPMVELLRDELGARITRWDGAADDRTGKMSVDLAARWWALGRWKGQGSPPSASQAGNWLKPDGKGRTFYVGRRQSGKVCRVYEKGKQRGDPHSKWVRWEVEIHREDREIPWGVLLEPRSFLAGSYPCMRWVTDGAVGQRIRTVRKEGAVSLAALVRACRDSYGPLFDVLAKRGAPTERVVSMMTRPGVPRRLELDEAVRLDGAGETERRHDEAAVGLRAFEAVAARAAGEESGATRKLVAPRRGQRWDPARRVWGD
jgi:phage replication initiation protein